MFETIVWFICVWGSAALFCGIGIYAERREKPMWFWSGTSDKEIKVTDVKAHNKDHGVMWKQYSLWFWIAGIAYIFNKKSALAILTLSATVGLVRLYLTYKKIERKYIIK